MARRPNLTTCLACRHVRPHAGKGRCAPCLEKWNRQRERTRSQTRQQPWYDNEWRRLSRETIEAHVRQHGYVCTACPNADPRTNPLTLDHVKERSLEGGTRVLCRRCNSSKGARHGNAQRRGQQ